MCRRKTRRKINNKKIKNRCKRTKTRNKRKKKQGQMRGGLTKSEKPIGSGSFGEAYLHKVTLDTDDIQSNPSLKDIKLIMKQDGSHNRIVCYVRKQSNDLGWEREYQIMNKFKHTNIVKVYGKDGESAGSFFMDFCNAGDLGKLIRSKIGRADTYESIDCDNGDEETVITHIDNVRHARSGFRGGAARSMSDVFSKTGKYNLMLGIMDGLNYIHNPIHGCHQIPPRRARDEEGTEYDVSDFTKGMTVQILIGDDWQVGRVTKVIAPRLDRFGDETDETIDVAYKPGLYSGWSSTGKINPKEKKWNVHVGFTHSDLKPENIFLSYVDGVLTPRIGDFGLAFIGKNAKRFSGTRRYTPPECLLNHITYRSIDHWGAGMIFLELFMEEFISKEYYKQFWRDDECTWFSSIIERIALTGAEPVATQSALPPAETPALKPLLDAFNDLLYTDASVQPVLDRLVERFRETGSEPDKRMLSPPRAGALERRGQVLADHLAGKLAEASPSLEGGPPTPGMMADAEAVVRRTMSDSTPAEEDVGWKQRQASWCRKPCLRDVGAELDRDGREHYMDSGVKECDHGYKTDAQLDNIFQRRQTGYVNLYKHVKSMVETLPTGLSDDV